MNEILIWKKWEIKYLGYGRISFGISALEGILKKEISTHHCYVNI